MPLPLLSVQPGRLRTANLIDYGYQAGSTPLQEVETIVHKDRRSFRLSGVPADAEYTFTVAALRHVDPDVHPSLRITNTPRQAAERSFQPSQVPNILGNVGGRPVADLIANLVTVANITSDSVLSSNEKPGVILEWGRVVAEYVALETQATTFNLPNTGGTPRNNLTVAYSALAAYLAGLTGWNTTGTDTPINATAYKNAWAGYYDAAAVVHTALDGRAATTADWDGVSGTGKTDLINASNNATSAITAISADTVLHRSEKPSVIREWEAIQGEVVGLRAQADAFTVSRVAYDAAHLALGTYLTGLSPAWNSVTTDTTIVPATFNTKWSDYYVARTALLTAIDAKAGTTADWNLVTGSGKTDLVNASNAATLAITAIGSDSVLSRGEKGPLVREYLATVAELAPLRAQADALAVSRVAYDAAHAALAAYLTGLSPPWSDTNQDTTIVPATFNGKWNDYYGARAALLTAIDAKSATVAVWTGVTGIGRPADYSTRNVDGANMIPSPLLMDRAEFGNGATKSVTGSAGQRPLGQVRGVLSGLNHYILFESGTTAMPVVPNERIYYSYAVGHDSTGPTTDAVTPVIQWYDSLGVYISEYGDGPGAVTGSQITAAGGIAVGKGSVLAPAAASFVRFYVARFSVAQGGYFIVAEPFLGRSQQGADITLIPDGPAQSTDFLHNYTGVAESGQFPRALTYKLLGQAGALTSGVTWRWRVITGNVNGLTAGNGWQTSMTGTGTGTLSVTSVSVNSTIEVEGSYNGFPKAKTTELKHSRSAQPVASSGGGSGTLASKTSGFAGFNSSTQVNMTTGDITFTLGATATPVVNVSLYASPEEAAVHGTWTCNAKVQKVISGTPSDVASVTPVTSTVTRDLEYTPTQYYSNPALLEGAISLGSLAAGTHTIRVLGWLSSGTKTHYVGGSVTVTI